jgi:hypothetical protein
MAAAIEAIGMGASGAALDGALEMESTALFSPPADGSAAPSARSRNAGATNMPNAAMTTNLALNLIVVSPTARRDDQETQRRISLAQIGNAKQRIA